MTGIAPHILGLNSIDTQDPSSYTPTVKKQAMPYPFNDVCERQVKIRLGFGGRNRNEQNINRIGFVIAGVRWNT